MPTNVSDSLISPSVDLRDIENLKGDISRSSFGNTNSRTSMECRSTTSDLIKAPSNGILNSNIINMSSSILSSFYNLS